jgi:dTDP-4-amino-4,6-dideoxygalactose transaminase
LFFIKTKDATERENLIKYLNNKTIQVAFHYLPLHTSQAGIAFGRFEGTDVYTTKESERLLRLPMFYKLKSQEIAEVTAIIKRFYETKT